MTERFAVTAEQLDLLETAAMQRDLRAFQELLRDIRGQLVEPARLEVPEDFVVVPRTPSDEQVAEAVYNTNRKYDHDPVTEGIVRQVYRTMISARPLLTT